ncbi:MAG: Ig-like domain-containing protein, partial [Planctomycetota bacterium]
MSVVTKDRRIATKKKAFKAKIAKRKRRSESRSYGLLEPRKLLAGIPVAIDDPGYTTAINTTLTVGNKNAGFLSNDFVANASQYSLTEVLHAGPQNGTVSFLQGQGTFTYTPNPGFEGWDSFEYYTTDGTLNSEIKTVSIAVGEGLSAKLNGEDRTQSSFLHDGDLALSQPIGSGMSLEYRSDTVPISIIPIETFLTPGTAIPNSITVNLTVGGVNSGAVNYGTFGMEVGTPYIFNVRALTQGKSTGMYDWTATFDLNYSGSTTTRTFTGKTAIINRIGSPFG